jgi:predicted kinase
MRKIILFKKQKRITITVGISGSGKTFFRKNDLKYKNYIVVSKDDIRFSMFDYFRNNVDFYDALEPLIKNIERLMFLELLKQNYNIFLDGTYLTMEKREFFIRSAKDHKYQIELIVFTNFQKAIMRNSERLRFVPCEVIKRQIKEFQKPNEDEIKLVNSVRYID